MNNLFLSGGGDEGEFIPIFSENDEELVSDDEVPETLPILTLKNTVVFSGILVPISVGRKKSIKLIKTPR